MNFVFSAFDHMIIFGSVNQGIYITKESFIFHHYEYFAIFVGLFHIIKTLASDSTVLSGIFCKKEKFLICLYSTPNHHDHLKQYFNFK